MIDIKSRFINQDTRLTDISAVPIANLLKNLYTRVILNPFPFFDLDADGHMACLIIYNMCLITPVKQYELAELSSSFLFLSRMSDHLGSNLPIQFN
jgi:hypothetical protein